MRSFKTKGKSIIVTVVTLFLLSSALLLIFGYDANNISPPAKFSAGRADQTSATLTSTTSSANGADSAPPESSVEGKLIFFNVGHGDSSLIQYPVDGVAGGDRTILIDTGKPEDHIAQRLIKKGVGKIDYLIITHPHPDHIGGLEEVKQKFEVGKIIEEPYVGKSFKVIKMPKEYEDPNDNSLVIIFRIKGKTVVIFGDNEFESQRDLVKKFKWDKKEIYLLKYPHHGVDDFPLYLHLRPEITVISSGTDGIKYHIPAYVIEELEGIGSKVYWTARDGDIEINVP